MIALNETKKPAKWCPGSTPDMDLTRGLRGYWPLWEGAGMRASNLVNHAGATLTNMDSADWVAGAGGRALDFVGGKHVSIGARIMEAVDNWTLIANLKVHSLTTSDSSRPCIMYNGDDAGGYGIFAATSTFNLGALYGSVAWFDSGTPTPLDEWFHVAAVRSKGILRMYLNGVQCPNTSASTPRSPSNSADIGKETGGSLVRFLDGTVADCAAYDRALAPAQIKWLYRNPFGLCRMGRGLWPTVLAEPIEGPYRAAVGNVWHGGAEAGGQHLTGTGAGIALVDGQQAGRTHG